MVFSLAEERLGARDKILIASVSSQILDPEKEELP